MASAWGNFLKKKKKRQVIDLDCQLDTFSSQFTCSENIIILWSWWNSDILRKRFWGLVENHRAQKLQGSFLSHLLTEGWRERVSLSKELETTDPRGDQSLSGRGPIHRRRTIFTRSCNGPFMAFDQHHPLQYYISRFLVLSKSTSLTVWLPIGEDTQG